MSKRKDQLMAAVEKATQKQHSAEQEKKRYLEQLKQLERNERTHRLCTRGAYLETLLQEPEVFSDEEVFRILDYVFGTPYAKSYLKAAMEEKHRGSDGEKTDTTERENDAGADVRTTGNS